MGYLFSRIKPLRSFCSQLSRSYHISAPFLVNQSSNFQIRVHDRVYSAVIQNPQFDFPSNVRFFAAPVQAKPKQEAKETSGPRLNEKIKADIVRLVSDEGHDVVSRMEALKRAAALNLDLVEVDRNAKPPVCKIMDFHREKYKQQLKDKDRVKSKSEVTLRKGACKEVRFSHKIEQKDLEMKAIAIKRLLERGYRVKCMATNNEKDKDNDNEKEKEKEKGREQDKAMQEENKNKREEAKRKREEERKKHLGELVDRLSAMEDLGGLLHHTKTAMSQFLPHKQIEEVSFVESGPNVEKKQAYIVVRHIKFGLSKKGGSQKKASKTVDTQNHEDDNIEEGEVTDQSGLETDDEASSDVYNRYKKRDNISVSAENKYKKTDNTPVMENRYKRPENLPVTENRYKRPDNPPVAENRYNRGNNPMPTENRFNRENNSPVTENRYNRGNNSPLAENRYRRDQQYNPNGEGGGERVKPFSQVRPNNSQPQPGVENIYRNGNNFDPARRSGPPTPPYNDGH